MHVTRLCVAEDLLNLEDCPKEAFIRRSSISSSYDMLPEELGRYGSLDLGGLGCWFHVHV